MHDCPNCGMACGCDGEDIEHDEAPDDCSCDCYDGPEPDFDAPSFRETYELAHREKRRVRGL